MGMTPQAGPATRLRDLARRRPVTLFLGLALGGAYALSVLPILMQFGVIPGRAMVARLGIDMERAAALLLMAALFPAALLVTALEGGPSEVRLLLRRMLRWRVGLGW